MYGVETCVHPTYQGQGIGSALMDARFYAARELNLRGVIAGSIPMDYHKARHISLEDYVRDVVASKRFDTNLTKQLKKGFQVHNLIPNYLYDPRSRNWGVAIVWHNPDFRPARPSRQGFVQSRLNNQKSKENGAVNHCREDGSAPQTMSTKQNIKNNSTIVVVPSSAEYTEQMQQLQHIVYHSTPEQPDGVLLAEHFRNHLKVFPEGQFIALDTTTNTVVGLTVSMRMNFDPNKPFIEPWSVTIGDGWLNTHIANGEWMYGVESCVHPDYQGMGIGSKLMDARFDVACRLNLKGMVAGSAIIDYYKVPESVSPEEYVQGVIAGKYFDTNLTKQIRKGFKPHCLIPNYLHDPETRGWGVTIVWENPEYRPGVRVTQRITQPPSYTFTLRPRLAV